VGIACQGESWAADGRGEGGNLRLHFPARSGETPSLDLLPHLAFVLPWSEQSPRERLGFVETCFSSCMFIHPAGGSGATAAQVTEGEHNLAFSDTPWVPHARFWPLCGSQGAPHPLLGRV